jgi:GNAT superfamily N-acetyltransferase
METFEVRREPFLISTDKRRLNLQIIFDYLSNRSYWAQGRPLETVARSIDNSLCFGVYDSNQQVGFARVVTDYATFGWICDLFILESHRGKALGKWLIESIVTHPDLAKVRRLLLATLDAHELYRKYGGFEPLIEPERWLTRIRAGKTKG